MYFGLKGNHLHFIEGTQKCSATTNAENTLDLHSNYLLAFLHTQRGMSLTHTQGEDTKVKYIQFPRNKETKKAPPPKYTI